MLLEKIWVIKKPLSEGGHQKNDRVYYMLAIRSLNGIAKPCDEIIRTNHSLRENGKPLHTTRQSAFVEPVSDKG